MSDELSLTLPAELVEQIAARAAASQASVEWVEDLALARVFTVHKRIEAQETVTDEVLVTVPDRGWTAYRVELIIASTNKKRWGTTAVVLAPDIQKTEELHGWDGCRAELPGSRGGGKDSPISRGA